MAIHIYHYNTHAEKKYFLGREHHDFYDMIGLNGNIVSHTPQGVAAFISTSSKPFYIDPQTHAFQHQTLHLKRTIDGYDEFKPSIIKLAEERLSGVFSNVTTEDRPLVPEDFHDAHGGLASELVRKTCESVIRFQQNTLLDEIDDETREFIEKDDINLRPDFIISPYFYLSRHKFSDWLDINIQCYKESQDILNNEYPLYLALVISKDILYREESSIIVEELTKINPVGILLWIDEFDEETLRESELRTFYKFLQDIKNTTSNLINSHGGYLSIMLCHKDSGSLINGVGHSINYGENRSVVPVGGGIPMARYYFPSIHSRLRFGDALDIAVKNGWLDSTNQYHDNICGCAQCKALIHEHDNAEGAFFAYGESNPVTFRRGGSIVRLEYPTKEAKEIAARHYLYVKTKEFRDLDRFSLFDICDSLNETFEKLIPYSDESIIGHLYKWHSSLTDFFPLQ